MKKTVVLAVDDEEFNLDLIELALSENPDFEILKARNGKEALEVLKTNNVDVILLDLAMPVMNGIEVLKHLKSDEKYARIPVIVITANAEEKNRALELGANDFLAKPIDVEELRLRTLNHSKLKKYQDLLEKTNIILEQKVKERTKQLREALELLKEAEYETALRLGMACEFRDTETGMHIKRVSLFSKHLASLAGLSEEEQELILRASPLHDIGKIGIPDSVLLKPGRLTKEEFEIIKKHTLIGGELLKGTEKFPVLRTARIIALQHHERWDGKGYPYGLKENEIHIFGRIVAIADVFDALTSKRVYKPPMPVEKAIEIMKEGRGTQFDPDLLDVFLKNVEDFIKIKEDFPDTQQSHLVSICKSLRGEHS